jgi:dipeptidase
VSLLSLVGTTAACTIIAVGKIAGGGSSYLAHTDDAGGGTQDIRVVKVPAADWPKGSKRPVYATYYAYPRLVVEERGDGYAPDDVNESLTVPIGEIPQVPHTYGYWDTDYGVMNDQSLAIAESTCGARTAGWGLGDAPEGVEPGKNMFGVDELSRVALERCDTARCAIETMGAIAEEYGFYSNAVGSRAAPLYEDSVMFVHNKYPF